MSTAKNMHICCNNNNVIVFVVIYYFYIIIIDVVYSKAWRNMQHSMCQASTIAMMIAAAILFWANGLLLVEYKI